MTLSTQSAQEVQDAEHLNEKYRQTLKCMTCKFETKKESYLTTHMKLMNGPSTEDSSILFCPHCAFGIKVAQSLKNHINAQHEDQKRYSCNLCSFRSYYRHHVKSQCAYNHQGPELRKVKKICCTNCENDLEHNDCKRSHPIKDNSTQSNTIEGQSLEAAFSGIIELFMKHR